MKRKIPRAWKEMFLECGDDISEFLLLTNIT